MSYISFLSSSGGGGSSKAGYRHRGQRWDRDGGQRAEHGRGRDRGLRTEGRSGQGLEIEDRGQNRAGVEIQGRAEQDRSGVRTEGSGQSWAGQDGET